MTMKRITLWIISLILATITTYILFEFTPVAIPFIEGAEFTVLSILMMAVTFSIPLDMFMKAGVFDGHGWHLGLYDPMGPLVKDDAPPPDYYKPIVSREQRMKQKKA
ncbi:MAG: hypothetical protein ACPGWR_14115 [Ardenticatenaceae bacterium]